MTLNLVRVAAATVLTALGIVYPFLPGDFDPLAVPLSTLLQLFGAAGVLLVPISALWLVHELRARTQVQRDAPKTDRGYYFAIVSFIMASIVAIAVSLLVSFGISIPLGVLALALCAYVASGLLPRLKPLKEAKRQSLNPAPLYLVVMPLAVLLLQGVVAGPLTELSRSHAIASSNEFVRDIETYYDQYGHYPVSLAAMWKDYYPDVVGIEKFHYSQFGDSYNLFFEQPRIFFDNIGTREWVVYNPNDEHRMFSHTAWFLLLTPEELERSQGWYAVHDAEVPHWRYFWFD